jgi:hypothetical protein
MCIGVGIDRFLPQRAIDCLFPLNLLGSIRNSKLETDKSKTISKSANVATKKSESDVRGSSKSPAAVKYRSFHQIFNFFSW